MSAAAIARASLRGGYGAVLRRQATGVQLSSARAFSNASRLQAKLYAKTHEWLEYSSDKKTATVGVSKYAAQALGDVVYVELPQAGSDVASGDSFGAVESVKSASELYAPVGGKVVEANSALEEKPGMINKDPEGDAWIAKIEVTGEQAEELMDETKYKEFTESEQA